MMGLGFNKLMIITMVITSCMMETNRQVKAMSCGDVSLNLSDCMWYLFGHQAKPSLACCRGVKHLEKLAKSNGDNLVACDCVRETIQRLQGISMDHVDLLARECSAKLPYFKFIDHCDDQQTP
ncbi:hypothetical protein LUZ60_010314 [Juncus effusus]|nr:hypothetical protein LUZ60_010314 [Juncus effusus]